MLVLSLSIEEESMIIMSKIKDNNNNFRINGKKNNHKFRIDGENNHNINIITNYYINSRYNQPLNNTNSINLIITIC